MRVRAKSCGITETRYATMLDVGDGEPRVGASDIDRYEFH
jgi:hypothetical protein